MKRASKGKIERFFRIVRDQFLAQNLDSISSLEELNDHFIRWVEDTYHIREHSTLGMRPLDRFGMDLGRIRHLHHCDFNDELFFLETTRKVRIDNTFNFRFTSSPSSTTPISSPPKPCASSGYC